MNCLKIKIVLQRIFPLILVCFSLIAKAQNIRHVETINDAWSFYKGEINDPFKEVSTRVWEKVTIPHSWNTEDILDDEDGYYRGDGWYQKTMVIPQVYQNQQVFLFFEAANQITSLFVNGKQVGEDHIGGYTAFTRDITAALKPGKNTFLIKVNNAHNEEVVPLFGDFSFLGGIYRDVQLIITKPVHFEIANQGANGIFITTPEVSEKTAKVSVKSLLIRPKNGKYSVRQSLYDANNSLVKQTTSKSIYGKQNITELSISSPKLWSPDSPYLYKMVSEVLDSKNTILDRVENSVGFRWFHFDAKTGFFINGKQTKLIGTNRHQDFYKKANALSDEIHRNDMKLLKDMGVNFLRIAHYPQDPAVLEMCNKYGFVATLEIPFVDKAAANETGKQNSINMLKEAIRFNYNNPCIVAWNLGNETTMKKPEDFGDAYIKHFIATHKALAATIKEEDKTRYSYSVFFREPEYQDGFGIRVTDLVGYNKYFGWYLNELDEIEGELKKMVNKSLALNPDKPFILSEYGAGADPRIRSFKPSRFDFSVEYQFLFHKEYMKAILKMPEIVGANVWNFADFQAEHRVDAVPHVNNKGLLTVERKKKDVYYLYQAILKKTPFLAIASKDWTNRAGLADNEGALVATQPLTIVGNTKEVELFVNGTSLGKKTFDFHIATFDVPLKNGSNLIEVVSLENGQVLKDFVTIDFALQPNNFKSKSTPFTEIAINVGSQCYFIETDNVNYLWLPDQAYKPGNFGYVGGEVLKNKKRPTTIGVETSVKGTDNDPIYQTQIVGINQYKFDVPKGTYELSLLLAELETKDENVMDIAVNGKTIWSNLNLKTQYGDDRGVVKRFLITVEGDNGISIDFKASKGKTRLSGVKLRKVN